MSLAWFVSNVIGLELQRGPAKAGPGATYAVIDGVGVVRLKDATPKFSEIRSGTELGLGFRDG